MLQGDERASSILAALETFKRQNPHTLLIDAPELVQPVLDRCSVQQMLSEASITVQLPAEQLSIIGAAASAASLPPEAPAEPDTTPVRPPRSCVFSLDDGSDDMLNLHPMQEHRAGDAAAAVLEKQSDQTLSPLQRKVVAVAPHELPFAYPVIVKPAQACGGASSHRLAVVRRPEHLVAVVRELAGLYRSGGDGQAVDKQPLRWLVQE